ncbi:MAG TPA: DUF3237 domain-containing protein [Streptosporangiaceae bacterium]
MTVELVALCTVRIQLKPPTELGAGPAGTRIIGELASAEFKGDRLAGELLGAAAADWLVLSADGTGMVDARLTLRTNDGAAVFVQYEGRMDFTKGLQFPVTAYVAPRFETGDQRYAWLNRIQAIGKGTLNEDLSLDYEWYEVR